MEFSELEKLDFEALWVILKNLDLSSIQNICQTNSSLNQRICLTSEFWKRKYLQDFGKQPLINDDFGLVTDNWKDKYYQRYSASIWVLGERDDNNYIFPIELSYFRNNNIPIQQISGNQEYIFVLDFSGRVWVWDEQTKITNLIPFPIQMDISISQISENLALDIKGQIWKFVRDQYQKINLPDKSIKIVQISSYNNNYKALDQTGKVWDIINNKFTQIEDLSEIIQISVGKNHSLALNQTGKVYAFGQNNYGQLGIGSQYTDQTGYLPVLISSLPYINQVECGGDYSLVLDSEGQVWGFGQNEFGQLGVGTIHSNLTEWYPIQILKISKVKKLSAGETHSLALDSDGQIWGFGENRNGGLGLGYQSQQNTPAIIPGFFNSYDMVAGENHSLILGNRSINPEAEVLETIDTDFDTFRQFNLPNIQNIQIRPDLQYLTKYPNQIIQADSIYVEVYLSPEIQMPINLINHQTVVNLYNSGLVERMRHRPTQELAVPPNTAIDLKDISGRVYTAIVYINPDTGQFSEPI